MTGAHSKREAPTFLFCSVGRRIELLRAFRRAYEGLGLESRIVGIDIDPLAPALQSCDRFYLVPRLSDSSYVSTLTEICRRERVKVVFPLIDPDIPVLAEHRAAIEATGARGAIVSPQSAALTADKWETGRFFARLGLQTPRSWLPAEIDPAQLSYPVFIKPRGGSAGEGALQVRNEREMRFFVDYIPDPIVQEFLPGPEITCDVVTDPDGDVLSIVLRRRIEVRNGEVSKGVTVHDSCIMAACETIARALPATGPITVQCMLKDKQPYFTEINARLGGGFPLGIAAGADSPRWLVARAAGIPVSIPPLGSYRAGCYLTRYDESYFFTEDERDRIAGHHFRPG